MASILLVTSTFAVVGSATAFAASTGTAASGDPVDTTASERASDQAVSTAGDSTSHRSSLAGTSAVEDDDDRPPTRHLGFGGPGTTPAGAAGGEFNFGTPPVPDGDGHSHDRGALEGPSTHGHGDDHPVGNGSSIDVFSPDEQAASLSGTVVDSTAPPDASGAGNACPSDAPTRNFTVHAIQVDIVYNKYGQHDPNGTMYVLEENRDEVLEQVENAPDASIDDPDANATTELVQPLTLRAHVGDCINIEFVNELDETASMHPAGVSYGLNGSDGSAVGYNADSTAAPGETVQYRWYVEETGTYTFWDAANQVMHDGDEPNTMTIHPHFVGYDVLGSDGVTLGYNYHQGVEPGEEISYRWYADEQGTVFWHDHLSGLEKGMHGTFGAIVVEPENSTWLDPETGEPIRTGTRAIIEDPNGPDFREYALAFSDGKYVVNADGSCPVPPIDEADDPAAPCNEAHGNPEDQGFKSVNYAAEPLARRLADDGREHLVFSSHVHGDPATPVLEAYAGDPVRIRYAQTADKSRGITFHLAGHRWPREERPAAAPTAVSPQHLPGSTADVVPTDGAGGHRQQAGDYYYGATKLLNYVEGGQWGIFRVHDEPAGIHPLPDRRPDAPTNLSVRTPDEERELELDWDDHPNPEVEGYNVYRSTTSGGPYTKVNDDLVANSTFRDDGLVPGTTYYYVVTAVDAYGQESPYSGEANGTTKPLLRVDDVLDGPVRGEIEVEIEADSEVELEEVQFRVKDSPTEVRFRVQDGEIDTSGDAVVDATMDPDNGTYTVVWDTDVEADGDLDVRVRAKDTNGRTTKRPKTVRVDNTEPEFDAYIDGTLISLLDTPLSDNVTLEVDAVDNHTSVETVAFEIDDGGWSTVTDDDGDGIWETVIDTTEYSDGSHTLKVKVVDEAGNVKVRKYTVEIDNLV